MPRQREEVLNVILGQCICATGLAAAPESITRAAGERVMPDVIVSVHGLRCAIEGKVEDAASARATVLNQAKERVETGVAHMAIAVVYPTELRETPFVDLPERIKSAELSFLMYTESEEEVWRTGNLDAVLADLRRAYQQMASDDVVEESVSHLTVGMEGVVNVLMSDATADRLAELLGVYEKDG